MTHHADSIKQVKVSVRIDAPSEVCYQAWTTGFTEFPQFMHRLVQLQQDVKPFEVTPQTLSAQKKGVLPSEVVNHWLFRGPQGKLYELDNKTILEIPNLFYGMASTDPDDIASQSSLSFLADANNQTTLVEFQVSFWDTPSQKKGKSTQLITDLLAAEDTLLADCLEDFKKDVEAHYKQNM